MEGIAKPYKIAVFLSVLTVTMGLRVKRRAGDQAPNGQCATFKWGGTSGIHWYACCNNCKQADSSCDGKTYQSASTNHYCAKCGIDTNKGNGRTGAAYPCGGCKGQELTRKNCLSNIRSVYHIPGLCWAFAKCFKEKCKSQILQETTPTTCFNLRCDPGENVYNCPTDCCGTKNENCNWGELYKCVPQCCSESTCCSDPRRSGGFLSLRTNYICIVSIIISVAVKGFNV